MTPTDRPAPDYRPCVGVMLFNRDGRVFAARRFDTADAWQMPQGGIDDGESPEDAARRELREETGAVSARVMAEFPGWLSYDLPADLAGRIWGGKYRGQTQKWFALEFLGEEAEFDLTAHEPEFSEWKWVAIDDLPKLIVPFKRAVYQQVVAAFRHLAEPAQPL